MNAPAVSPRFLPALPALPAGRGKSPPVVFPRAKTSGFNGCCAPGIASLRSSRLFIHSLLALLVALAAGPASAPRAAEPEKLPAPAAQDAAGKKGGADKKGGAGKKADADKKKPEQLDRAVVYRYDPIQTKLVAVPAAEIKKDHVYYRYSPARGRHVWSKAAGQGKFLYALGPGSVQPVRLFDIRATDEEKRRVLESRAPTAAKLFVTQGAQPSLRLDEKGDWKISATPIEGSVFDLETGRRLEWHGDRAVEVVHSGGNSWSRRGDRYVPAGAVRSMGW